MAEEDLIFGKNRHFFGGIEPSNMRVFGVAISDNAVLITATLPEDTVINNQTLCTVEGAVIRRKTTDYPKDEFDGDLVTTLKASSKFVDSTASTTGTYYYAAFPYTTQGVYNRNKANRTVINEPEPMQIFSAKSIYTTSSGNVDVELTCKLPSNVAGAIIRKSTINYPVTETEGELVQDITADGTYTDSNITAGEIYYYSAFPYTSTGAVNRSETNRTSAAPKKRDYLFGYDLVKATSDPASRVTYPSDVDNATYTPAAMNFSHDVFEYGDWDFGYAQGSHIGKKFMPRPCMLTYDGKVEYYLDPDNYYLTADAVASDVDNVLFNGNAMMEWPKIYTKRWEENGIYHFRCSDIPLDDDWECWCNYDRNNNQIEHFYTSIYTGTVLSGKMRSLSDMNSTTGLTAEDEISYAKANGDDWYTEVLADRLLIVDLLVMMAKTTNLQRAFGYGNGGSTEPRDTGFFNSDSIFVGYGDYVHGVKVFGMEHLWGNLQRRIAGWMYVDNQQLVKLTRGTHDGSTATDYNVTGDGYISVANSEFSGSGEGYISDMTTESFGRLPIAAEGSSSTYETNIISWESGITAYATVSGSYQDGQGIGPFYVGLDWEPDRSHIAVGVALSCKPLATT